MHARHDSFVTSTCLHQASKTTSADHGLTETKGTGEKVLDIKEVLPDPACLIKPTVEEEVEEVAEVVEARVVDEDGATRKVEEVCKYLIIVTEQIARS